MRADRARGVPGRRASPSRSTTKRQGIVDSWPADVDDAAARRDWGFAPRFDLESGLHRLPDPHHPRPLPAGLIGPSAGARRQPRLPLRRLPGAPRRSPGRRWPRPEASRSLTLGAPPCPWERRRQDAPSHRHDSRRGPAAQRRRSPCSDSSPARPRSSRSWPCGRSSRRPTGWPARRRVDSRRSSRWSWRSVIEAARPLVAWL